MYARAIPGAFDGVWPPELVNITLIHLHTYTHIHIIRAGLLYLQAMRRSLFLRRLLRPPQLQADAASARLAPAASDAAAAAAASHADNADTASGLLLAEALARVREGGTGEGTNLVAYSGGVDSSLVAALLFRAYPRNSFACIGAWVGRVG